MEVDGFVLSCVRLSVAVTQSENCCAKFSVEVKYVTQNTIDFPQQKYKYGAEACRQWVCNL